MQAADEKLILNDLGTNVWPLNPPNVACNLAKTVDECSDYRVKFVQFRYCWDWGISSLYGIRGFPHFRSLIVHKHMEIRSGPNKVSAIS